MTLDSNGGSLILDINQSYVIITHLIILQILAYRSKVPIEIMVMHYFVE